MPLPIKRVPRAELPFELQAWLDGTKALPPEVTWLRGRRPSGLVLALAFGVLFAFCTLAALGMLVFEGSPFGLVLFVVGAVPFAVTVGIVRSQRRAQRELEASPLRLGLLWGPTQLLYAPSADVCTVFWREQLEPVVDFLPLGGRRGHRQVRLVQEVPEEQRRVVVELGVDEVQFHGDARALSARLEAWRRGPGAC